MKEILVRSLRVAAAAGVLMLIGACATELGVFQLYKGPKQPDSAIARIHVPGDIGVVSVDERSVFTLLSGDDVELRVLPGTHKISLRYYRIFESGENIRKIISDPVTKSLTVRAGHVYRVEHDSPETLQSATTYAPVFDYRIREIGAPPGGRAGAIVAGEAALKPSAAVASEVSAQPPARPTVASEVGRAPDGAVSEHRQGDTAARAPLEQLKYWWGQASDVDRRNFRRWIQSP
jgi:uncharacterized protein YccT (UPF0319 family)